MHTILLVGVIICAVFALIYAAIIALVIRHHVKNRATDKLSETIKGSLFLGVACATFVYFCLQLIQWM